MRSAPGVEDQSRAVSPRVASRWGAIAGHAIAINFGAPLAQLFFTTAMAVRSA
jgi:hypothetical protein